MNAQNNQNMLATILGLKLTFDMMQVPSNLIVQNLAKVAMAIEENDDDNEQTKMVDDLSEAVREMFGAEDVHQFISDSWLNARGSEHAFSVTIDAFISGYLTALERIEERVQAAQQSATNLTVFALAEESEQEAEPAVQTAA